MTKVSPVECYELLERLNSDDPGDWNANWGGNIYQALLGDELIYLPNGEHTAKPTKQGVGVIETVSACGLLSKKYEMIEEVFSHTAKVAVFYAENPL